MVNEEIVGALKSALERGESLKRAAVTLLNSGYKQEEVDEAVKFVNSPNVLSQQPQLGQIQQPSQPAQQPQMPNQPQLAPQQQQIQQPGVVQKVSNYISPTGEKDKIIIVVLITTLVFLVMLLMSIFIFKSEIIKFFSSLVG
jgi:hypothetical protein